MKKLTFVLVILALLAVPSTAMAAKPGNVWYVPGDFASIQEAIDDPDVMDGDTIRVGPGNFAGALIDKSVTIKGEENAVIDSGPMHPAGLSYGFRLLAGSDDATLSHLTFDEVDLAIMNGDAVNGVTVTHCRFNSAIQAVSNWRGSGWEISHNTITDLRTCNGGGIGSWWRTTREGTSRTTWSPITRSRGRCSSIPTTAAATTVAALSYTRTFDGAWPERRRFQITEWSRTRSAW